MFILQKKLQTILPLFKIPNRVQSLLGLWLFTWVVSGCSYHYQQGVELEAEQRWEEASIEYRLAFVEDPDDEDIIDALARVNPRVALENMLRYRDYLSQSKYKKAYSRLVAASVQNPQLESAQKELKLWTKILIAGKVDFEFDRLQSNIRLADEMQLQFLINTPVGDVLEANISYDSGLFFVEDILYRHPIEILTKYSVNSIGLKLVRKTISGFKQKSFKKFINFRGSNADQIYGKLEPSSTSIQSVKGHRLALIDRAPQIKPPWFPPRSIQYQLNLKGNQIQVVTSTKRLEIVPKIMYVNREQQRVFIDFGEYFVKLHNNRSWSIQRQIYQNPKDDYYHQFSKNLALNPYFFYREGAYQYVLAP